ncbi:extracellular solute-binding protein [Mobilitalea sibirica]|uniref:Extracellular solute-binding protein n=1 Tax=Mobilitalea sibirica TaxID=1462919 RepID=A0A8J7H1R8_9FIRM|nr:extracellular solute-binding protein [Mobilitalea sibirica]MBH1940484.1 extracellular solute-binding protein [Mobilitalea sibirica]
MKLNWKKLIGFLFAVALVMTTLAACGKESDNGADPEPTTAPTEAAAPEEEVATPTPTEAPVDLGGMEVVIGDWWTVDPPAAPQTQREEDTLAYREEIQKKHNFVLKRQNIASWMEYQEVVVTSIMAGDPLADVFVMDQKFIAAPLQQGLLYPLDTLENFNFDEEKWNPQVRDMMTFADHTYGMATGKMEPRLGVFWNKRLFEEAGLDPELPYDLQAKGEWTWEALEEIAKQTTRDINNDGTPDVYGISSFSKDFFRGAVFSNDAQFIGVDENGKFYNATGEPNFLEALNWGYSLYEKGYHMPQPEDSNWDWFISTFVEGKVAMQCAEQYKVNTWRDMEDDWGFVIFPKGPKGEMMTVFTENIVVMPVNLEKEEAEKVAFAYNLYTETTPGYEDEDWKTPYYAVFRDARAVEETLPLFYEPDHGTISYLSLIAGIDYGDVTYDLDAGALTGAESVEKVQGLWQSFIDEANGVEE